MLVINDFWLLVTCPSALRAHCGLEGETKDGFTVRQNNFYSLCHLKCVMLNFSN